MNFIFAAHHIDMGYIKAKTKSTVELTFGINNMSVWEIRDSLLMNF